MQNHRSILYLTGYLTKAGEESLEGTSVPEGQVALVIPNAEVREIYESTIKKWFADCSLSWKRCRVKVKETI